MSKGISETEFTELEQYASDRDFKYAQFRTQLRNLILCYMHAVTQSGYVLKFYDNGAIKSISPRGETND